MKKIFLLLFLGCSIICSGQVTKSETSKSKYAEEIRLFLYKLDDTFNLSMVTKDSIFFANHFAESFINCTPLGEVNFKTEEISTLLKLPLLKVERTASKYDIFKYADKIAIMSVTKKLTRKDFTISYVRRTIIYELINGKWLIVSGQGTFVLAKYIE